MASSRKSLGSSIHFLFPVMELTVLSGIFNTLQIGLTQDIFAELIDDVCLGLCFEVHRSAKCGFFFLDDMDAESMQEFEIVDKAGVDIFGQVYNQCKNRDCECPNCGRTIAAARFAPHLEKCLGMGRNSSRLANRRLANSNNSSLNKSESDPEDNDDINDNDWSYSSEKKGLSNLLFLCNDCRSHRCPQHTDDQRRSVRVFFLGPSGEVEDMGFQTNSSNSQRGKSVSDHPHIPSCYAPIVTTLRTKKHNLLNNLQQPRDSRQVRFDL
uniref:Ataxin-7-like protein 3 n=1 Tax=Eptatretus burgeri TaxID=7764 RepID=A0A8C4RBV0_EPTBU